MEEVKQQATNLTLEFPYEELGASGNLRIAIENVAGARVQGRLAFQTSKVVAPFTKAMKKIEKEYIAENNPLREAANHAQQAVRASKDEDKSKLVEQAKAATETFQKAQEDFGKRIAKIDLPWKLPFEAVNATQISPAEIEALADFLEEPPVIAAETKKGPKLVQATDADVKRLAAAQKAQ